MTYLLVSTTIWMHYDLDFLGKVVVWNHINNSAITVRSEIEHPANLAGATIAISLSQTE